LEALLAELNRNFQKVTQFPDRLTVVVVMMMIKMVFNDF
jgi:hypothetical protein